MKRTLLAVAAVALHTEGTLAFVPVVVPSSTRARSSLASSLASAAPEPNPMMPYGGGENDLPPAEPMTAAAGAVAPQPVVAAKPVPKRAADAHAPRGVLSPLVLLAKQALGEDRLNKVRARAISLHSDVIGSFVDTSASPLGQAALRTLFRLADADRSGTLEAAELAHVFRTLGFDWLQDKQVQGILKRADTDSNGTIDLQEFLQEAPKTLRTNLIKLAKKNGGELGLLV